MAWSSAADGLQPRILPSSVSKMNRDDPECPFSVTTKFVPGLGLATAPVGALCTSISKGTLVPSPRYSVEESLPLSATHQGETGVAVSPQAFTSFGST